MTTMYRRGDTEPRVQRTEPLATTLVTVAIQVALWLGLVGVLFVVGLQVLDRAIF